MNRIDRDKQIDEAYKALKKVSNEKLIMRALAEILKTLDHGEIDIYVLRSLLSERGE